MTAPERMHRLLMGDVGTGKTVVALFAMLLALENDYQAALMAPTELLAEQHFATLTSAARAARPPARAAGGPADAGGEGGPAEASSPAGRRGWWSGTHALIEESVAFQRLGLVVIDEQHRFGVEQRARLIAKGDAPDVLLLTATPIPRSLALTRFGDLDVSTLKTRPPGRGSGPHRGADRVAQRDAGAGLRARAVLGGAAGLRRAAGDRGVGAGRSAGRDHDGRERWQALWPDLAVGLVHGRLKAPERDERMRRFRAGEIQVLVATTVIEVGIDVPNATVMLIEHPERFGLAQLHQLRGRIGRGAEESYCILLSEEPVPARLKAFAATTDGFKIAELDLEERKMGDLIGERQAGDFELRLARLPDDADLLRRAPGRSPGHPRRRSAAGLAQAPAAPGAGADALSPRGGAVPDRVDDRGTAPRDPGADPKAARRPSRLPPA